MARHVAPAIRLHRAHGAAQHVDRRELEHDGWRTTLEYRENHVRARDGRLTQLQVVWQAEAERRVGGERADTPAQTVVIAATASSVERVWSRLRMEAELADIRLRRRALSAS
jgi:hypothetical protein